MLSGKRVRQIEQGGSAQAGHVASPVANSRVGELDALRGLAVLSVVAFHYTTFYQQEQGHLQPLGFGFPAGNYGVHLFFLISGFVIFMSLERTRSAMDFAVSRFSRLFPAYWAAMAITAAVVYTISLYLLHQAIGFALIHLLEAAGVPSLAAVLATVLMMLALAAASTYGV